MPEKIGCEPGVVCRGAHEEADEEQRKCTS